MRSLDKKKNLLIITKIDTIDGLMKKLKKRYNVSYFPNASLSQLKRMSKKEKSKISAIFTNPNRSKIRIDNKILKMFLNLDVICTASTGLVHIDTNLCKKKKKKIYM